MKKGFTLIELLIVLAIIGLLSSIVIADLSSARDKAHFSRTLAEFRSMATALEFYLDDHGSYPADVSRNIPPGLGIYLAGESTAGWPEAAWPDSVYDWDNWPDPDNPGQRIYQISVRFCPIGGNLSDCRFPNESWAEDFGINSAVYYCVSGVCRSHINEDIDYPGYCVNC